MADKFTRDLFTGILKALPKDLLSAGSFWQQYGLDPETLGDEIIKMHKDVPVPFSAEAWTSLGMAIGFMLGRASCDPSFNLAVEMAKHV